MSRGSLFDELCESGALESRWLWSGDRSVQLSGLSTGTSLGAPVEEFGGRSVLLATTEQLPTCLALLELDGIARRIILCTPDISDQNLRAIVATAEVDTIVGDCEVCDGVRLVPARREIVPAPAPRNRREATEWILLTSGTTGMPKLVRHSLATLTGPMRGRSGLGSGAVWSTFYDMRRYGGLQIFLRAILGGGSMVLSSAAEPVAEFAARVARHRVTHISGTPSHWRRLLISDSANKMGPRYVRLSGEIADQSIIDQLRSAFPAADIAHAFASTEAGVAFEVGDGRSGFPKTYLDREGEVDLRVDDGSLRIRSTRNALGYLGGVPFPSDDQGFIDTGDMVALRGDRYAFVGRRGGIINVGGLKVHPEEVEDVINRHPAVRMSLIRSRKNPITGAVVVADVMLKPGADRDTEQLRMEIADACRRSLDAYKVPALVKFVPALDVAPSGKLLRSNA